MPSTSASTTTSTSPIDPKLRSHDSTRLTSKPASPHNYPLPKPWSPTRVTAQISRGFTVIDFSSLAWSARNQIRYCFAGEKTSLSVDLQRWGSNLGPFLSDPLLVRLDWTQPYWTRSGRLLHRGRGGGRSLRSGLSAQHLAWSFNLTSSFPLDNQKQVQHECMNYPRHIGLFPKVYAGPARPSRSFNPTYCSC